MKQVSFSPYFFAAVALLIIIVVGAESGISQRRLQVYSDKAPIGVLKDLEVALEKCQMFGSNLMNFLIGRQSTPHQLMSTGELCIIDLG